MQYKSIKGFTGFGQLGILFVFLGLGFIMAALVQLVIGMQIVEPGTPFKELDKVMLKAMMNPKNVMYARLSQVLGTLFLLFIPAVMFSKVVNGNGRFWLGFNKHINAKQVLLGFLIIFTANMLASPLADISKKIISHYPDLDKFARNLENLYSDQVMVLSNLKSWPEFLTALAIMAFFPALFEEVFFRGAMQNLFVRWWKKPLLAIIFTSLIFSLIHGSVYLFISRAVLGMALGLMYHISKNIWVNVVAHFLNNALALAQLFYMSSNKQKISLDKMDPQIPWWTSIFILIVLYFLFIWLRKVSANNRLKIDAKEQLIMVKDNTHDPFSITSN